MICCVLWKIGEEQFYPYPSRVQDHYIDKLSSANEATLENMGK